MELPPEPASSKFTCIPVSFSGFFRAQLVSARLAWAQRDDSMGDVGYEKLIMIQVKVRGDLFLLSKVYKGGSPYATRN